MGEPTQQEVLDPKHAPQRVRGKRSATSAPMAILVVAVLIFIGVYVYDKSRRLYEEPAGQPQLQSALGAAEGLMEGYHGGLVPGPGRRGDGPVQVGESFAREHLSRHADRQRARSLSAEPGASGERQLGAGNASAAAGAGRTDGLDAAVPTEEQAGSAVQGTQEAVSPVPAEVLQGTQVAGPNSRTEGFVEAMRAGMGVKGLPEQDADGADGADQPARQLPVVGAPALASPGMAEQHYLDELRRVQESGALGGEPFGASSADGSPGRAAYQRLALGREGEGWELASAQHEPKPFALLAGSVIPAVLLTGINSDLPGQVTAQVSQDVRDTATGRHVLIPYGTRLVGTYGSDVNMGQERVLVAWQLMVWPDGRYQDIGGMPGTDGAGQAGLHDQVNTHFWRLLGSAVLMSGVTAGISLSQGEVTGSEGRQTVGGTVAQGLGAQVGQLTAEMIRKQMNVAPTLQIRPGYRLNVSVTKHLAFDRPYIPFDYSKKTGAEAVR